MNLMNLVWKKTRRFGFGLPATRTAPAHCAGRLHAFVALCAARATWSAKKADIGRAHGGPIGSGEAVGTTAT